MTVAGTDHSHATSDDVTIMLFQPFDFAFDRSARMAKVRTIAPNGWKRLCYHNRAPAFSREASKTGSALSSSMDHRFSRWVTTAKRSPLR